MAGTVLVTGANGSLAIPVIKGLLESFPSLTLILTVRDDSDQDHNTAALRRLVSQFSNANASIRKFDLASLEEVTSFSDTLRSEIDGGKIPRLVSIICNAFSWGLSGGPKFTKDGYERTIAINHLAHFALSLRLLGSMDAERGRIIFLGSEAHRPEPGPFNKGFPTHIPDDMDLLLHPQPENNKEELGRGFQRYGTSKLVAIMVMFELNRRLKNNKDTESIRAIAIDPLGLVDSRAFLHSHVPISVRIAIMISNWLLPLLRLFKSSLMSVEQAAKPVVDVAVADEYAGQEGYYEGSAKIASSTDSLNEETQRKLWDRSVTWCGLKAEDTVIVL